MKKGQKGTGEEEAKTVDSLSAALAATRPVFDGHPAEDGPGAEPEPEDKKQPEPEPEKTSAKDAKDDGDKGDDKPNEPDASDKDTPKFKHKTWEETEKARREAEQLGHRKAEEAKTERDRADGLQRKLDEIEAQRSKDQVELKTPEFEAERKAKAEELAKKFTGLDQYADGYQEQAAAILAEMATLAQPTLSQTDIKQVVEAEVQARLAAAEADKRVKTDAETAKVEAHKTAVRLATEAGLDMGEDSIDADLFWTYSDQAPRDIPLDEQVEWVANKVKTRKAGLVKAELGRKAKEAQKDNAVLERGSSTTKTPAAASDEKSDAPLTLNQAMQMNLKSRRV